ncbi:UDP-N-acetylglucosamine 2-epimerase (non-hydrolyzing) [Aquamicrobium terrae]
MSAGQGPSIDIVAGARPNFMKVAPIIRALETRRAAGGHLRYRLVHTGQHHDARMSATFFAQLGVPAPDVDLAARSGTQAEQTAAIMVRYEQLLLARPCRLCLVVGDVNSTMACALAARKVQLPVAHVEAGLRCGDRTMPEEINRKVVDAVSDWFFTTSRSAGENLVREGVEKERIFFVGNTMADTLLANLDLLRPPPVWHELDLSPGAYFVVTLHRPANVDAAACLARLLEAIAGATRGLPVVFPVHPRTAATLGAIAGLSRTIHPVEPQPYLEFNHLVRHAKAVITDSGGVSEETTVMGVPCLTLRDGTERPETVTAGTNEVVGSDPAALDGALERLFAGRWKRGGIPERWDGRAGGRIAEALEALVPP